MVKGDGSFGVVRVYRWGARGDMRVAVKELRAASLGLSAADEEALTAEAGLQAQLEHNNVVRVWGVACDAAGMHLGLVMKVRGGPLSSSYPCCCHCCCCCCCCCRSTSTL